MRKAVISTLVISIIFLFNACSSEKVIEEPTPIPVYLPMSIGNYWIYQHFNIDSLGNETPYNIYDSIYIVKDTIIEDKIYHVFESSKYFNHFKGLYRDSLGYLIKSTGEIIFSTTNFTDTIHYDYGYNKKYEPNRLLFYTLKTKMNSDKQIVHTPSGDYNALVVDGFLSLYYYDNSGNVVDTINTNQNLYFAPNIGLIKDTYYYYSEVKRNKSKIERRLLRYKTNE